ncbi:MAG TPA: viral A-type inclusion protein [Niabella sp.]|nr:viral A-type inclusion protein [Niabella sp.]HQX21098.1 viral A-type inclusion protein [Niabella sp.]HRB51881.1 viral A-type inclusion protein [Niabella sp.]HRC05988.1 viral A-type inclusion protein [Niabella sp.]HRC22312.1 viral A-type inclusion protein [Niabella sp.]
MRVIFFFVLVVILAACNSSQPEANTEEQVEKLTVSDSLLKEVLKGHDVAMPKMFKLERLQKELTTKIDSLKKASGSKSDIALYENLVKKLSSADAEMHSWMEGFSYDTLKDNEAGRLLYLNGQLESVNKMKENVLGSLAFADSVLAIK